MSDAGSTAPASGDEPGLLLPVGELSARADAKDIRMVPCDSGGPPASGRRKRPKRRKNKGGRRCRIGFSRYTVTSAPIIAAACWHCDGTWDVTQWITALGVIVAGIVDLTRAGR